MDKRYELYCAVDPLFYDSPERSSRVAGKFGIVSRPLPEGWEIFDKGQWIVCVPPAGIVKRTQGWKIHVSACLDNAEEILELVWEYCVERDISFKYLRGKMTTLMRNAKYAPRGGSGKFITIYPADDNQCELLLTQLDSLLAGQPGPYILSDLRYGDGPLYVRYGGFTERYCEDEKGELVHAIENGDGRLVPDTRPAVFSVPDWIELPGFLVPHLEARKAATMTDLPYRPYEAMHFSNGGGVYKATDTRNGETVVLKEARPYAGLAADGSDAVARLKRERDILLQLDGISSVPAVRDYFECGDHHFLVQEFIEGTPLNTAYVERYPLLKPDPSPDEVESYTAWALRMMEGVAEIVRQLHERGIVFNDLHMFNVMVRPDDSVALLDFEAAAHVDEGRRPIMGNPAFLAPRDRRGFDIDGYSLACMRLGMFLHLTTLVSLDPAKAEHLAEIIAANFPGVPPEYLAEAVQEITRSAAPEGPETIGASQPKPARNLPPFETDPASLDSAKASLTRAILASATPERDDRLFPGDPRQFDGEALGIGHGAAGVLYALSEVNGDRFPQYEQWLIDRALAPAHGTKPGLYDGLTGVACVLHQLGHADEAVRVAEICASERWQRLGSGLFGGTSGIALGLLWLGEATGESSLTEVGMRAVEVTADRLKLPPKSPARAGLMQGATGPALLFVRMYERTGDTGYLDLAAVALGRDLDNCVIDTKGALAVNEGWRTMPYLGDGSAGIGMVARDYLSHREDERFAEAVPQILRGARSRFYAQSGLLAGRAGLIVSLCYGLTPDEALADPDVAAQVQRLAWHAVSYADGTAFPGEQLMRLSVDLATGTAGVLLALHSVQRADAPSLPFVGAMTSRAQPCS